MSKFDPDKQTLEQYDGECNCDPRVGFLPCELCHDRKVIGKLRKEIEQVREENERLRAVAEEKHSYHDLEIETAEITRTSIFDLPYGLLVTCSRGGGWELWKDHRPRGGQLLAGEFGSNWLRLHVGETVIVDSEPCDENEKEVGEDE